MIKNRIERRGEIEVWEICLSYLLRKEDCIAEMHWRLEQNVPSQRKQLREYIDRSAASSTMNLLASNFLAPFTDVPWPSRLVRIQLVYGTAFNSDSTMKFIEGSRYKRLCGSTWFTYSRHWRSILLFQCELWPSFYNHLYVARRASQISRIISQTDSYSSSIFLPLY